MRQIGVPFDLAIVASEVGSYKPAHGHWQEFLRQTRADPSRHVHVAASSTTTSSPPASWEFRRLDRPALRAGQEGEPAAELPDVVPLADTLDRVLPA